MQSVTARERQRPARPLEYLAGPVLIADSAWEVLLGTGLILTTVGSVAHPLGAATLRPWFLPVAVGACCLALAAFLLYTSRQPHPGEACRLLAIANLAAAALAIVLMIVFPHAGHPYALALAIASTGCAIFAVLEWAVSHPPELLTAAIEPGPANGSSAALTAPKPWSHAPASPDGPARMGQTPPPCASSGNCFPTRNASSARATPGPARPAEDRGPGAGHGRDTGAAGRTLHPAGKPARPVAGAAGRADGRAEEGAGASD